MVLEVKSVFHVIHPKMQKNGTNIFIVFDKLPYLLPLINLAIFAGLLVFELNVQLVVLSENKIEIITYGFFLVIK